MPPEAAISGPISLPRTSYPRPGPRGGWYLKNFFAEQPALNFGYARLHPDEPWRVLPEAAGPQANKNALRDIVSYWLDRGVAGFRVDMAFSLVKDDPDLEQTTKLWRELATWMHETYPGSVLLPESDEARISTAGVRGGFDADFALVIHPEHSALFNNGGAGILPWQESREPCYFDPDVTAADGTRALQTFLTLWNDRLDQVGADRLMVLPSADHDFSRLACGARAGEQLRAAFLFLLTWGSIPSIYYGDEIGMRYLDGLPDTEGSIWNPRFNRAGCRTPMQWDKRLPNDGFSTAHAHDIYLPQDPDPDRPTVRAQLDVPDSLLHFVRDLIHLRRTVPGLRTSGSRQVLSAGYPFVYVRGGTHLIVVNPRIQPAEVTLDPSLANNAEFITGSGISFSERTLSVGEFGHGIFNLQRR